MNKDFLLGGASVSSLVLSEQTERRWRRATRASGFETMMQLFQHCTVPYGDKPVRGVSITCGKCGREERKHFNTLKHGSADSDLGHRLMARKFEEDGWRVGNQPSRHRCPDCVREARAAQMRFMHANKTGGPSAANKIGADPVSAKVVDMPKQAEPPREMTREDRRIVFAKLQEAYDTETTGYCSGWTDERVANDLGVPLAWVREMRCDYFGPLGSNPEIDALLVEARGWRGELVALLDRATALQAEVVRIAGKGEVIERRLAEIAKAVGR